MSDNIRVKRKIAKHRYKTGDKIAGIYGTDIEIFTLSNTDFDGLSNTESRLSNTSEPYVFLCGVWADVINDVENGQPLPRFRINDVVEYSAGKQYFNPESKYAMTCRESNSKIISDIIKKRVYSKRHNNWWYQSGSGDNWFSECGITRVKNRVQMAKNEPSVEVAPPVPAKYVGDTYYISDGSSKHICSLSDRTNGRRYYNIKEVWSVTKEVREMSLSEDYVHQAINNGDWTLDNPNIDESGKIGYDDISNNCIMRNGWPVHGTKHSADMFEARYGYRPKFMAFGIERGTIGIDPYKKKEEVEFATVSLRKSKAKRKLKY